MVLKEAGDKVSVSSIGWYNENELRSYPIHERATRVDDSGAVLPNSLIVDIGVVVPKLPPGASAEFTGVRISSVTVRPGMISLGVSCDRGGLLVRTFPTAGLQRYRAYPLYPLVNDVSGWVAFGSYNHNGTAKDFKFSTAGQSGIESRCLKYVPAPGITRFVYKDGDMTAGASGVVKLVGTADFTFRRVEDNPNEIRIGLSNAVASSFLTNCNKNATTELCGHPPIRTINGVGADENGAITIRFE